MGNYTFLREICLIESFLVKVEKSAIYEYDKYDVKVETIY